MKYLDGKKNNIKKMSLLTSERERELSAIIKNNETNSKNEALVELIESNSRLVAKESIRYSKISRESIDDLYSSGRVGLIEAAYNYDPCQYDTRFSTYATYWIKKEIIETLTSSAPVKIPSNIAYGLHKKNKIINGNGMDNLSRESIKKQINVTESQMNAIDKAKVSFISLNADIDNSKISSLTFADLIEDKNAKIPGHTDFKDCRYDYLEKAIAELDDLSRDIIYSQIVSEDKITLSEIASKYGITSERVRQIKDKALSSLKKKIISKMSLDKFKKIKEYA